MGDLIDYIYGHGRLDEEECKRIFSQLIESLDHCHSHNIVHRDIKPENILLDGRNNVKLADFNLSAEWKRGKFLTQRCGTRGYAAPELLQAKCKYEGPEVDIWSSGVVLHMLMCKSLPFADADEAARCKLHVPEFVSPEARDLLQHMLKVNPKKRFKMKDVQRHPWLRSELAIKSTEVDQLGALAARKPSEADQHSILSWEKL